MKEEIKLQAQTPSTVGSGSAVVYEDTSYSIVVSMNDVHERLKTITDDIPVNLVHLGFEDELGYRVFVDILGYMYSVIVSDRFYDRARDVGYYTSHDQINGYNVCIMSQDDKYMTKYKLDTLSGLESSILSKVMNHMKVA